MGKISAGIRKVREFTPEKMQSQYYDVEKNREKRGLPKLKAKWQMPTRTAVAGA